MGTMIKKDASAGRIHEVVKDSSARSAARGGSVAVKATERLTDPMQQMAVAKGSLDAAVEVTRTAEAATAAALKAAAVTVGSVHDEMYNLVLRANDSAALEAVFPGGIGWYSEAPREAKAAMLAELRDRIEATPAEAWAPDARAEWAARVEGARTPLDTAVREQRDARIAQLIVAARYRATTRVAWLALVAFKRDLKSLGMSEALVHEIIPSVPQRRGGASSGPDPGPGASS
jgi:hypothetical protein